MPPRTHSAARTDEDSDVDSTQESQARLKRKIATLQSQLDTLCSKSYKTLGRIIRKNVALYDSIELLIAESDRRAELEEADETPDAPATPTACRPQPGTPLSRIPRAREVGPRLETRYRLLRRTRVSDDATQLRAGASGAVGDDTNKVRAGIIRWIPKDPELDPNTRHGRGLDGAVTGALLCPVDFDWNDPAIRAKVIAGDKQYRVAADKWPACVYLDSKSNPSDRDAGLFKSRVLVQTYKHIYTSPRSADNLQDDSDGENRDPRVDARPRKKAKTRAGNLKSSVASKAGMRHVTPRSIAYAAVQMRFNLSDVTHWTEKDGRFDYVAFYNNIVDYFEVIPGPKAQKQVETLLAWWDDRIFGPGSNHFDASDSEEDAEASVAKMRAQRAARESEETV